MVSAAAAVQIVDAPVRPPDATSTYAVRHTCSWSWPSPGAASSHDDGVDEGLGVEGREVVGTLAQADELDRHTELALDRDDDPALGRAVELGQDDARHVDRLGEDLGLLQAVLPGRRVEDEEHLVDGALLLDDALDLAELVHQADLVVDASG